MAWATYWTVLAQIAIPIVILSILAVLSDY